MHLKITSILNQQNYFILKVLTKKCYGKLRTPNIKPLIILDIKYQRCVNQRDVASGRHVALAQDVMRKQR